MTDLPTGGHSLYEARCLSAVCDALFNYYGTDKWIRESKYIRSVALSGAYPDTLVRVRWWDSLIQRWMTDEHPLWRDGAPFWVQFADPVTEVATNVMDSVDECGRT